MSLQRIATSRKGDKPLLELAIGGKLLQLSQEQADSTVAKLAVALQADATTAKVKLPTITIHKNRDGSFAVATGKPPGVWPEDEIVDKER